MLEISEPQGPQDTGLALYVVATPIGHLSDLSERARHLLLQVKWVAAEDTRVTKVLLQSIGASARTLTVHQHNEREAAQAIVDKLRAGESVALVSDAGTPAISDPGARVVEAVREAGFRVVPLPGPNAITTLLSASGLPASGFLFDGFLPVKTSARQERLGQLLAAQQGLNSNVVVYEAPHRIAELAALLDARLAGDQRVVIGRELTKRFEQIVQVPAGQVAAWVAADPNHLRGEFVVAWGPAAPRAAVDVEQVDRTAMMSIPVGELLDALLAHLPASRAAKLAHQLTGVPRDLIYRELNHSKSGSASSGE
jgi:16S rRNA (cytidine1402-2'-O)-methyltransferase